MLIKKSPDDVVVVVVNGLVCVIYQKIFRTYVLVTIPPLPISVTQKNYELPVHYIFITHFQISVGILN